MTVVRELVTLLGFRMNDREATRYEQRLNQVASNVNRFAAGIGAVLATSFGIDKIIEAGDAYTNTMNRLRAATTGPEEAAQAFERLYQSARETGVAMDQSAKGVMRFAPAMRRAGYGIDDTIGMLDGLQKGLLAGGATASETSSVFTQLGQAINSGVLQGEELNALLENSSDTIVQAFARSIGVTSDKLKEMASQGKLTAKNVLPALLAAAKAGRAEFAKMQTPVQLAMDTTRVSVDRLIGEFDRAFRFTERLARQIEWAGARIDKWRDSIPTIKRVTDEFGGMDQILAGVALGIGAVTVAAGILNPALVILTGTIAFVGAAIQDLWKYVQNDGTKTLTEELLGPYDQVAARLRPVLEELKASFLDLKVMLTGAPDEVAAAWERLAARIKAAFSNLWREALDASGLPDWAKTALGGRATASTGQAAARANRPWGGPVGTLPPGEVEGPDPILEYLQRKIRDGLGALGFQQRVDGPDGTPRLLRPGENMNDVLLQRDSARGATTNNMTVTNNAPVEVTVNATGNSGAEIAGAAERGVRQGLGDVLLGADRLARDLAVASPRFEGAAGTGGGF
ncbi:phage tail tape measure protein [Roseomonas chloroacetimidivorans]|uniref:phage tail tape measure protein n=1 Tax=Roseomonas chloroacetimidivorans TaxID=1766656 RepID=UPI003C76E207